jgi:hypothetical protein
MKDKLHAIAVDEAKEKRAEDVHLYRGLYNAMEYLAKFMVPSEETWAGLLRVSAWDSEQYMERALECLLQLRRQRTREREQLAAIAASLVPEP